MRIPIIYGYLWETVMQKNIINEELGIIQGVYLLFAWGEMHRFGEFIYEVATALNPSEFCKLVTKSVITCTHFLMGNLQGM